MGPPKCGAPGNCPICPPLKPALCVYMRVYIMVIVSKSSNALSAKACFYNYPGTYT